MRAAGGLAILQIYDGGRIAKPETRGQVYGFTATAQFLGRFVGPLLGSSIAATFGIPATFVVIGCLMVVNLAWVWARVGRGMLDA